MQTPEWDQEAKSAYKDCVLSSVMWNETTRVTGPRRQIELIWTHQEDLMNTEITMQQNREEFQEHIEKGKDRELYVNKKYGILQLTSSGTSKVLKMFLWMHQSIPPLCHLTNYAKMAEYVRNLLDISYPSLETNDAPHIQISRKSMLSSSFEDFFKHHLSR